MQTSTLASSSRPCSNARSSQCHRVIIPRAGTEGLFGGLKRIFGPQQQQQGGQLLPSISTLGTTTAPEFPPFRTVKQAATYDLRLYDIYPVVETDYDRREEGYLVLGSYQDGANAANSKFGFTQPVVMHYYPDGRKVMQLMVGTSKQLQAVTTSTSGRRDIASLPVPTDPAVRLGIAGGEVVAVFAFEGYITPSSAAAARHKLMKALQEDGIQLGPEEAAGFFRVAQYGRVYSLSARVNELQLRVQV